MEKHINILFMLHLVKFAHFLPLSLTDATSEVGDRGQIKHTFTLNEIMISLRLNITGNI